jgi:hypothetical protein
MMMGRRVFGAGEPVETVDDDSVARTFAGGARTPTAPAAPIVAQQLIDASIAQHVAQADPHLQYTTEAEATAIAEAAAAAVSSPVQSVAGRTGDVIVTKADVGLGSVDNTSDADKPISTATATALGGKEATGVAAGLIAAHEAAADPHPQYTTDAEATAIAAAATGAITKASLGLGSVDNTADADKPISTATATALGGKEATGVAAALVAAHEGAADPHPVYVTAAELATLAPKDHYVTHTVIGIL